MFMISSVNCHAFPHGYERSTDFIYAVARHGMTVYDEPGGEVVDFIPDFEGVVAIGDDGAWYEVRYRLNKKTHYGYVTKDEFNGSGLEYDGRDKQIIADGNYRMEYHGPHRLSANPFYPDIFTNARPSSKENIYTFTYDGDNAFLIKHAKTDDYLSVAADGDSSVVFWGDKDNASSFVLIRRENVYRIMDKSTMKYLVLNDEGDMELTGHYDRDYSCWRLLRTTKAVKEKSLRSFCQYDPQWAHYYYGKGPKRKVEHGNYSTSGCGALATFNAIYSTTGQLPDVFEIGRYAAKTRYRIDEAGTDSGFFKVAAKKFGYKYGFKYDGSSESFDILKKKLNSGDVAIAYLPGHYGTVVKYSSRRKKYLLLDPHKIPRRGTSEWGDWVTREDLSSGDLYVQMFFFYRRIDDH